MQHITILVSACALAVWLSVSRTLAADPVYDSYSPTNSVEVNVVMTYGVVANNTSPLTMSNNVTAISNAVRYLQTQKGGKLFFPSGTYYLAGGNATGVRPIVGINLENCTNVTLEGNGPASKIALVSQSGIYGPGDPGIIGVYDSANVLISGLYLSGSGKTYGTNDCQNGAGVIVINSHNVRVTGCSIENMNSGICSINSGFCKYDHNAISGTIAQSAIELAMFNTYPGNVSQCANILVEGNTIDGGTNSMPSIGMGIRPDAYQAVVANNVISRTAVEAIVLDGQGYQTSVGCSIIGNTITNSIYGIILYGAYQTTIANNSLYGGAGIGLTAGFTNSANQQQNISDSTISGNLILGGGQIYLAASTNYHSAATNNTFTGNIIKGPVNNGIDIRDQYNFVRGNSIEGGLANGIFLGASHCVVQDNEILAAAAASILVQASTGFTTTASNNIVSGNFIKDGGWSGNNVGIANYEEFNTFRGNSIINVGGFGIYDNAANVVIQDNLIENPVLYGIYCDGVNAPYSLLVTGNRIAGGVNTNLGSSGICLNFVDSTNSLTFVGQNLVTGFTNAYSYYSAAQQGFLLPDVGGKVQIWPALSLPPSSAPALPAAGDIFFDASSSTLKIWIGGAWKTVQAL